MRWVQLCLEHGLVDCRKPVAWVLWVTDESKVGTACTLQPSPPRCLGWACMPPRINIRRPLVPTSFPRLCEVANDPDTGERKNTPIVMGGPSPMKVRRLARDFSGHEADQEWLTTILITLQAGMHVHKCRLPAAHTPLHASHCRPPQRRTSLSLVGGDVACTCIYMCVRVCELL